jgi:nucleoside recognition membrane protein YjiH
MTVTNPITLQLAIDELQRQCEQKKSQMSLQFIEVMDSMRPSNLLKSAVKDIAATPGIAQAAIGTSIAIGAGVLSKKIVVGNSTGIFKKLMGGIVEFTVANSIANNAELITSRGIDLLKKLSARIKE